MSDPSDPSDPSELSDSEPDFTLEPPAAAPGGGGAGTGGVEQLARRIKDDLQQRRGTEAARTLLEGQSQGIIPSHDGLLHWVRDHLGEDAARRLVAGFAHFPCVACAGGLEPCPACDGDGFRAEGVVCEACIGGGRVRCDFCAGSGLTTYNLVPLPLRRGTIVHRVAMARRAVERLRQAPLPHSPDALMNYLLSCNKVWCLLENAVTGARALAVERADAAQPLQQLVTECRATARAVESQVRQGLRALADACATAQSGAGAGDGAGGGGEQHALKADYYRGLAESPNFRRTLMHHPLLGGDEDQNDPPPC